MPTRMPGSPVGSGGMAEEAVLLVMAVGHYLGLTGGPAPTVSGTGLGEVGAHLTDAATSLTLAARSAWQVLTAGGHR